MAYHYFYKTDEGKPLAQCPYCGHNFDPDLGVGVHINLCVAEHTFMVQSSIRGNGELVDVDNAVANGYHAGTTCSKCGELLDEYEIMEE